MANRLASVLALIVAGSDSSRASPEPGGTTVNISDFTLQNRACRPGHDSYIFCDPSKSKAERIRSLLDEIRDDEIPPLLTAREGNGGSPGPPGNISRLGLPANDWGLNCLHGVQSSCIRDKDGTLYCPTSFPNPVNLGASWNASMWKAMGRVIGIEVRALYLAGAREYGLSGGSGLPRIGLDCWSPNININHDPRWGRNQEVPSEDPLINGVFGAEVTKGQQTYNGSFDYIVSVTTLKHWDAYSLEDADGKTRHNFNAVVSNATLADTFFPAWKMSVKAGAKGVMCSFNALNGVPACASKFLRDVLRKTWGFTGYQTSDTNALSNIWDEHHYAPDSDGAACVAIKAMTDMDSGPVYHDSLLAALESGCITRKDVNSALTNTLGLLLDMGLFDPVDNQPLWKVPISIVGHKQAVDLSRQAAMESMVLLKNGGSVLPLRKGSKLTLIGPHINATREMIGNYVGQMCVDNTWDCIETPLEAIERLNSGGSVVSSEGCSVNGTSTAGFAAALATLNSADAVVIIGGLGQAVEGEGNDRVTIGLPGVQDDLYRQVVAQAKAKGIPVVLVLLNGGMVALGQLRDELDALVDAFYPGGYGGKAIAATLFGDNDRLGGKMPYTVYPADYVDAIKMSDMSFNRAGTPGRSYKYYSGTPEFEFGFGLSLTKFEVAGVKTPAGGVACDNEGSQVVMTYNVSNVGAVAGDEVVQLYRMGGATGNGLPLRKKLIGFERVHLLSSEHVEVSFIVTRDDFADVAISGDRICTPSTTTLVATNGNDAKVTTTFTTTGATTRTRTFPDV